MDQETYNNPPQMDLNPASEYFANFATGKGLIKYAYSLRRPQRRSTTSYSWRGKGISTAPLFTGL